MLQSLLLSLAIFCLTVPAHAEWNGKLFHVPSQKAFALPQVAAQVHNGQVVIVSERHDWQPDHDNQIAFLKELGKRSFLSGISVAMEFFDYTNQSYVDQFLAGTLNESDFLTKIQWDAKDNFSFAFYRQQVLFPRNYSGKTYAINIPRAITNKISKYGLDSLSSSEKALMPPGFQLGNALYKERFYKVLSGTHYVNPQQMERYFAAQSTWDDTMAWKISEALKENPSQVIVVIVGGFHNEYGGGLPDRLAARGVKDVLTITQYFAPDGKLGDLYNVIRPHSTYGKISDLVWIEGEPQN